MDDQALYVSMNGDLKHINPTNSSGTDSSAVLLFDGECGFCAANVQFVLRHEQQHTLHFASVQSGYGSTALARHPELKGVDSMVWLEPPTFGRPETAFVRSEAALKVASYLGGPWRLALVGRFIPRPLRDGVYDWIAGNRHRLPGSGDQCLVPKAEERARFIDL